MNLEKTIRSLEAKGYQVHFFQTGKEAVTYLENTVEGKTIAFGGSRTLTDLNLLEVLSRKNKVYAPDFPEEGETNESTKIKSITTDCFFLSANGLSENGEIVNLDYSGNRLAGSLFGHKKVFYVVGTNKIEEDLEKTIFRVRNVACPMNAKRFNLQTPCTVGGKCYNCKSPQRICVSLLIHYLCPPSAEGEVILINEELGF